jgi:thiol:disulfide interchange protein DsbD
MSRQSSFFLTLLILFFFSTAPVANEPPAHSLEDLVRSASAAKLNLFNDTLLEPEQAFDFSASVQDGNTLYVNWHIAPNYYLYREKIKLELIQSNGVKLGDYTIPNGTPRNDEAFGQVEIFYDTVSFDVPIQRESNGRQTIILRAHFQGCAERGVCYPPMTKEVMLTLPIAQQLTPLPDHSTSTPTKIVNTLQHQHFAATLISFLGFGLLLSFTPCIFPMIPILSGIIVGQKKTSAFSAFLLSLSYVLSSAIMYTIFGILAALFGKNLQIVFQQPWIIATFSAILISLALSMFGFFNLDLPASLKTKFHNVSEQHRDGSIWGAAIMGGLSTLIVGPCVAAPLASALLYIGQTGDLWLGGSALFMLGLGMGIPLIVIGVSAGKYLPKAGVWMNTTKIIFGLLMLSMAIWFLSRIIPATYTLILWAMWLILPAIYLNALEQLPQNATGWQKLAKGLGLTMCFYGLLMLVGASLGSSDPLHPLQNLLNHPQKTTSGLNFEKIYSLDSLSKKLTQAAQTQQPVMLDFYADWCLSCKEMETDTFSDERIKEALKGFMLLQADITANAEEDQALLAKFNLIGPPAILFFDSHQQEIQSHRIIGYQDANTFLTSIINATLMHQQKRA